jgi:hypothetical protein
MQPLFLDIETIARPGAEVLLEEPQAPANYKDAAKIEAYIAEAKAKQREKMALDRRTCEIVTIGWAWGEGPAHISDSGFCHGERDLLSGFWHDIQEGNSEEAARWEWDRRDLYLAPLVGFNIYDFDWPVLLRRSCLVGIQPTIRWTPRKYQHGSVLDLMQEWVGWDGFASLKAVCRECGIPEPEGDGADVAAMTPEQRIAHCKSDVEATRNLYRKGLGYYW